MSNANKSSSSSNGGVKKLGRNIIIFSIGSFASKLAGYLLLPFYTAILTTAEYGIYDIVLTTVNLLFPIVTLLITEATMRFALEKETDKRKVFSISFLILLFGIIVMLAVSPVILFSSVYKKYYIYFVIYFILNAVSTLIAQFVKGIERTKEYATSGIIGTVVSLSFNILLMAVIRLGLTGHFIATFIGLIVSSSYLWIKCDLSIYFTKVKKEDKPLVRDMINYSLPIMPNSLSWWISTSSDKYIISFFFGATAIGLYSVAYKIPSLMTVFSSIFLSAWQISAVEEFGSEKSVKFHRQVYEYFITFLIIVCSGIVTFTKLISKILFANAFYNAWNLVPMLVLAYVFHDLAAFVGSVYTSSKKTKMLFTSTLVGAILNIILNIIIIPKYGAIGGAFTTLVSYFSVFVVRMIDIRKIMIMDTKIFKNSVCLLLLSAQVFVITSNGRFSFVISVVIILILCLLKLSTVVEILSKLLKTVKSKAIDKK